jgi:hypothetical protein
LCLKPASKTFSHFLHKFLQAAHPACESHCIIMKLQHHITFFLLLTSALPAATLPQFKSAPVAIKAPVVPKVVATPKVVVPVVKTPVVPKIPVTPKVVSAPKVPVVPKVVSAPKIPAVKVSATPKVTVRTISAAKLPQVASVKLPKTSVPVAKTHPLSQKMPANGLNKPKDFIASRVGPFHSVNKAYEKAAAPANPPSSSAPANTDPATAAGEMGWTPWWAAGSTSSSDGSYSSSPPPPQADPYAMSAKGPREPSKKKLLYAPNPVKKK